MIAAQNSHILNFDNLSKLEPAQSDALAAIATGGRFGKRQLYSDADEALFDARRPIILNGIPALATRGDLADRAIIVELEPIPASERRAERDLDRDSEAARPAVLGALLSAASTAMAHPYRMSMPHGCTTSRSGSRRPPRWSPRRPPRWSPSRPPWAGGAAGLHRFTPGTGTRPRTPYWSRRSWPSSSSDSWRRSRTTGRASPMSCSSGYVRWPGQAPGPPGPTARAHERAGPSGAGAREGGRALRSQEGEGSPPYHARPPTG
jgi:hypothetical protein